MTAFIYGVGVGAGFALGLFGVVIIFLIASTYFVERW